MNMRWQTASDREALLKQLVAHSSVTHSTGELEFPYMIQDELMTLDYFKAHPDHIQLVSTNDKRHAVVAFYKAPHAKDTITLISHFDTVGIDDYGPFQGQAFDMDQLTEAFRNDTTYLGEVSRADLQSGDYLFGRGAMDMKPGLMLHMALIEKASIEEWDVNLILMTVPDEEVTSKGMHAAVEYVNALREKHQLKMALHLNSEPTFQQAQDDDNHYYYTGSIGKIMPSVLVYGRETHVGTPSNGLSSNFLMSFIQQEIEYSLNFKEHFEGEQTPMPVSLKITDIKDYYDVQTPFRTVALFNLFIFKSNADDIYEKFNAAVKKGVEKGMSIYEKRINAEDIAFDIQMNFMTYQELYQHAVKIHDERTVQQMIDDVIAHDSAAHLQSITIVDLLMNMCRDLGPTVITFFTPPYYPATNTSFNPMTEAVGQTIRDTFKQSFHRSSERIHYFNGISDLSYVAPSPNGSGFESFEHNTPVFNRTYKIPFKDIEAIQAPLINCGPIGKDAHKVTERIHKQSAFVELPVVLENIIKTHFLA
ncbi:M20/M25/M40 family metallo-hydrolase [Staphylococcus agnetis]|uniref:M20/M25/M40 family metallo-hydrolase n=1 Tax=Staphylococcus agnetis TaxID=985762 RepID=UPI0004E2CFE4|nr:M20/M25/M40 family metallo-hydrolase [Staphylococcus agnetis]KFE41491.1 arginine utilization protein RocB [Staphylococcus agnetis]NJH64487.1 M20/M25/M40 family metallo-hydrolase [Staphylococcus agnetis]NJH98380.1 M20/M25/M40 family metallo-hydrolase [Staphylococcus agnetis]PTH46617.1 arginine utilization protein RocB [Staphylococcus agnetis]PTH73276.1 arginine utilization protein RocB [Staphylococcus agnetis]